MSRAFVKEPDEGAPDERLPERQISDHPNYVTPAGLRQLEQKLGELEERRLELLAAAENDDALARGQLDYIDRDLRYFTRRFETALLVEPRRQPRRMVKFGAAEALLEARVGATVLWRRPAGNRELTIEAIDYPEE